MQKHIAIVGGGPLGVDLAKSLDNKAKVTLIEQRSHFIHTPAMIRAIVDPTLLDRALIPYDKTLKSGKVVQGYATKIDASGVTVDNRTHIPADYVVIATGSSYAAPFKIDGDNIDKLRMANKKTHDMVASARTIAIVGAGVVGIELAGEIASALPDKKIILISKATKLMPDLPERFGKSLLKKLQKLGVEIILGERAEDLKQTDSPYAGPLTLSNGQIIEADIIFPVIGARANSSLLTGLPNIEIGRSNRVKVDPWLRPSTDLPNVFAAGDVAETGDLMTIVGIVRQIPWLKKMLSNAIKGKPITKTTPYAPWKNAPIIVPLGPEKGGSYLFMSLGNRITSIMKGKDLFLSKRNKIMGYK